MDRPRQKFLGVILNESDRMTHIVQDLLTLSRFDSGRSELKLAPFPFGDAVQDVYNAILMEAGVRSSWETLATNSRRMSSVLRWAVTS